MHKKLARILLVLLLVLTIFSIPVLAFSGESYPKDSMEDRICIIQLEDKENQTDMEQLELDLIQLTKEMLLLESGPRS